MHVCYHTLPLPIYMQAALSMLLAFQSLILPHFSEIIFTLVLYMCPSCRCAKGLTSTYFKIISDS